MRGIKTYYPDEVQEFILNNYKGCGPTGMMQKIKEKFDLSYTKSELKSFYHTHHLNSGLTGYFPKGNVPANKGKKGVHFSPATEFKKGSVPPNVRPLGSERITVDGYVEIKVREHREPGKPNTFELKQKIVWEAANGKIPPGYCLVFLDGDKTNCSLDNLACVSRADLARLNQNGLLSRDPDVSKAGIKVAQIKTKIGEIQRGRSK